MAFLCVISAAADPVEWHGLSLDASTWLSFGKAGFKGSDMPYSWQLEYPMDGWMGEVRLAYAFPFLSRRLSVRGRYAHSISINGASTDTDWTGSQRRVYSEADSEATVQMWDVDIRFMQPVSESLRIGGFLGYVSQEFDYDDTNLKMTFPYYHAISGPVSTYDLKFKGARIGGAVMWNIARRLSLNGEASVIPLLSADADAMWKLRDYPFQQKSDGVGFEAKAQLDYDLMDNFSVFTAVRYGSMIADRNGKEGGVADGEYPYSDEPLVDEMTSRYFGVEVGINGMF